MQVKIIDKIKPTANQKVFFTSIKYGVAYNLLNGNDRLELNKNASEILVTGIANADSLKNYLSEKSKEIIHFNFSDHHFFEQHELETIKKNYPSFTRRITLLKRDMTMF